jgi:uncharacterized membrane protein
MMIEADALGAVLVILSMAVATALLRYGGFLAMSVVPFGPRVERFINAMAGSVLIAVITPLALGGDLASRAALLTTAVLGVILRKPLPAIAAGIFVAALVRQSA